MTIKIFYPFYILQNIRLFKKYENLFKYYPMRPALIIINTAREFGTVK